MSTSTRRHVAFAFGLSAVIAMSGFLLNAAPPQAVGTWEVLGTTDPSSARSGAAMATLEDDTTLIAGGRMLDGTVTDSVLVYDPTTNASTVVGHLASPRVNAAAARLDDGRVLIVGGEIADLLSADAEIFDRSTGTSTVVANMAAPRTRHAATRLADGKVLIVGGVTLEGVTLATAEVFDPETGTILEAGSMATPRAGASVTLLIDNRVLVAGGNDGTQDLASAELFYPATQEFFPVDTALSQARAGHTAVLLPHNGAVLIAGGTAAGAPVATTDLFLPTMFPDPYTWSMGTFGPAEHLTHARSHAVSGPMGDDGYAFVAGGGAAEGEAYAFVTLKTDKDDYPPGEFALITGSGWQPGEVVKLVFQEDPAVHDDYVIDGAIVADADGNFTYNQWAPEAHDANVRFYLTATGAHSQRRAQMTFTDSVTSVTISAPTSLSPVSVAQGGTFTVSFSYVTSTTGATAATAKLCQANNCNPANTIATASKSVTAGSQSDSIVMIVPAGAAVASNYAVEVEVTNATSGGSNKGSDIKNNSVSVTAGAATTTTTVASSLNPSTYGTNVTFTASVKVGAIAVTTGSVTFIEGGTCALPTTTHAGPVALDGSGQAVFSTATLAVPSHTITACYGGPAGFNSSNGSVDQTVNPANALVVVTPYTVTYDGLPHSATVVSITGVLGQTDATVGTVDLTNTTHTDAGTYASDNWSFTGTANYNNIAATTITDMIKKASSTTTTLGDGPFTYDGTTQTGGSGTVTGAGGLSTAATSLTYTGDQVNAGTYYVTAHFAGDANHEPSDGLPVAIVINKTSSTTVTVGDGPFTYDTTTHTGGSGTVTGIGGLNTTATSVTYTGDQVNAGTYYVTAHYAGDANHEPSDGLPVAIVINKASSTTVTVGAGPFTYDTTTHTGGSGTVSGIGLNTTATSVTYTGDQVNAGTYYATAHYAGDANHEPSDGLPVAIVINKASSTTVTVGDGPFTFDTTTHMGGSGTVTLAGGLTTAATSLSYTGDQVNAGTYYVTAHFAGDANHYPSDGSPVAIIIEKATSTTTVTGGTFPFDGIAHPATALVSGVGTGITQTAIVSYSGSCSSAPITVAQGTSCTATANYGGDANHLPSSGMATVTITPRSTTTTLSSSLDVSTGPVKVVLTATVGSALIAGLPNPTPVGTVTFTDSVVPTMLGTVNLVGGVATLSTTTLAVGQHVVTATYNPSGAPANFSGSVSAANDAPAALITGPATGSINPINVPFNFTGAFTDVAPLSAGDPTAAWSFDGTSSIAGSVSGSAAAGTVANSKAFTAPGVYGVVLTVNDNLGGISIVDSSGGLKEMVIVYDANGGFVTGGGWINSPVGAYVTDISLTGKANFGFVSKYKKGASIPEGETEFQFHAAGLNFKSTSYQWLVVQGTSKAQYKGVGTINGAGSYQFLVSVVDGSPDKIRVKITNGATIVYDNLFGAPLDDAEPTTALGGGSIVIHTK